MASKLLIRPAPLVGESFYSWLSRVGTANISRGKRRVLELAGLLDGNKRIKAFPKLSKPKLLDLSKLTGIEVGKIEGSMWADLDVGSNLLVFSGQFLFSKRSKICPVCLEHIGYWKKEWQLLAVTCCVKHHVRLTTACKCGRPIEVYQSSIIRCECGRRLSCQQCIKATYAEVELARYVLEAYAGQANRDLLNKLYEVQFCLWFWYQSVRGHDDELIRSWCNKRIVSGIKYVGQLLKYDCFDIAPLMTRHISASSSRSAGFRAAMGNCHDYMRRLVEVGYTGNLAEQLLDFEEHRWHGSTSLRRSRYGASSLLKTKKEVATDYLCNPSYIERVIEYGDIALAQRGGRTQLVDTSNEALMKESVRKWLSLDRAAQLLGVSKDWVLQLFESKMLDGRKGSRQRDWLISRESCHSLIDSLKEMSSFEEREYVPLKTLQLFPKHNFSLVVSGCLARKILYRFKSGDHQLSSISIDREFIQGLEWNEKAGLFTAREVSEYLDINLNAFYYLVNKGYITTSLRYCRNRKVYGFSREDLDSFLDTYCFYFAAKIFLIKNERTGLVSALKACNRRCKHRGKIRLYKWQHIKALINKPIACRKPSLLYTVDAAAQYLSVTNNTLRSLVRGEWILPYKPPGHHPKSSRHTQYTGADLKRVKILLVSYPELIPLRAVSKQLNYDRSHIRRQFICSGYLQTERIPEYPSELFCRKSEVSSLKKLIARTVTGPQLATLMGVTRNTVYKWMRAGRLIPVISPSNEGFGSYRYAMPKQS